MPTHKSCEKRLRQEQKITARNNYVKMTIRTLSKKMHSDITIEEKEKLLADVYSKLDKAAKRKIIHKRTAARRKARLAAYFNKVKLETVKESKPEKKVEIKETEE
ncbi:MAG: 30S ribosomal protein S20 [Candidatus Cloacimonetes bacterium]|nr:30S ribosomal protein S20 [Candidatus Cloacimonadota bacterium]